MSNENIEKLKKMLATVLVAHEKMVNKEMLLTMQVPIDYIREKYPDEVQQYIEFLDNEYGLVPSNVVTCKKCYYRGSDKCICHPFYPTDDFYCARGDMK